MAKMTSFIMVRMVVFLTDAVMLDVAMTDTILSV